MRFASIEVLCIGHASHDITVFVQDYPVEDSKCETQHLLEAGGGPAANAAYLLGTWGVPCAFAGLLGDDPYGRRAKAELESAGVDVSLVRILSGHLTPVSIILVNRRTGTRTIVNRKLQGPVLEPDAVACGEAKPKVLLLDGHELEASLAALTACPSAISVLDAGSWREGTAELAHRVDYLVSSERFARQASDMEALVDDPLRRECLRRLKERFETTVIVTLGERGCIAGNGMDVQHFPAYPARVADTTAAGDVFHGAFAYGLAQAMPLAVALRLATMAASLSVRRLGGRPSIPGLGEVKEALSHVD